LLINYNASSTPPAHACTAQSDNLLYVFSGQSLRLYLGVSETLNSLKTQSDSANNVTEKQLPPK